MKFQKLDFHAFSKEKLTDNRLRSINGGNVQSCQDGVRYDIILGDTGCTSYDDGITPDKCDALERGLCHDD